MQSTYMIQAWSRVERRWFNVAICVTPAEVNRRARGLRALMPDLLLRAAPR